MLCSCILLLILILLLIILSIIQYSFSLCKPTHTICLHLLNTLCPFLTPFTNLQFFHPSNSVIGILPISPFRAQFLQFINEIQVMENALTSSKFVTQSIKNTFIVYTLQLQSYKLLSICSYILIAIETIQIASMSCVTPITLNSLGLPQFRMFTRFLNPQYYFRDSKANMFIVPICFCFSLFHCLLLVLTIKKQSRFNIIVHYLFIFYGIVGAMPSLSINLPIVVCTPNSSFTSHFTCFQGLHVLYFIFSLINILWLICCVLILFLFYIDLNPFNREYFSASSNLWILFKFAIKFSSSLFLTLDSQLQFNRLYMVVCVGLLLSYFGIFRFMWAFYRRSIKIDIFQIRCEIIYIFVSVFFLIIFFLSLNDTNNIAFLFTILLAIVIGELWNQIMNFQKQNLLSIFISQNNDQQPQQPQYIQFFNHFINEIQNNKCPNESLFVPLLKIHQSQCQNQQCVCKNIAHIFQKQTSENELNQSIYEFVKMMITIIIGKVKQNFDLRILSSYIMYEKLSSKIAAIHSVSCLLKNEKIGLTEQISLFQLNMKFLKEQNSLSSLRKFRNFSQKLLTFQNKVEIAIQNGLLYWRQLTHQDCEPSKIWTLADQMSKDKAYINDYVTNQLLSIYPKNIHTLQTVIQLLSTIYREPEKQIQKYTLSLENAIYENNEKQQIQTSDKNIFVDNSDIVVMRVAQIDGAFEFIGVSSNVSQLIKFTNKDLQGKNINEIMPQPYHQFHDKKIKQYFLQSDQLIKQRNASIFMLDGAGNTLNCVYRVKCLSTLEFGLEFVCFFERAKSRDSCKRKYISYYVQQQQQIDQNATKGKQSKRGNIVHIDNELKQLFFGEQDDDFNQQCQMKIQDLLPEWDLEAQKLKVHINNSSSFIDFTNIQIVHQDALSSDTFIKYLQFTFKQTQVQQEKPKNLTVSSFKKKKKQQMRNSIFLESSLSRLNLIGENNKYFQSFSNQANKQFQQPFSIPIKLITLVVFIVFCVSLSFSLVNFRQNSEKLNAQKNDFQSIQIVKNMSQIIFEVALQLQNLLYSSYSVGRQYTTFTLMIDSLNLYSNQLYQIYSYQVIDSEIKVDFPLLNGNQAIKTQKVTLNNAISYFISTTSQIYKNMKIQVYLVIINSMEQIYKACIQINLISGRLLNKYLKQLKIRNYILNALQFIFFIFLLIYYFSRTKTIHKFSEFTFQFYSANFDVPHIQIIIQKCQYFRSKVRSLSCVQIKQQKQAKEQKFFEEQNQSRYLSHLNQIQQSKQLLQMRKKITFHARKSILLFFSIAIIIFLVWVGAKSGLLFNPNLKLAEQNRILNRKIIMDEYLLKIKLQQLMYDLVLQSRVNTNLNQSLAQAESVILQLNSENEQFIQEIHIADVLKAMSLIREPQKSLLDSQVFNKFNASHIQISSLIGKKITSQLDKTVAQNSPLYLTIEIAVTLLTYFALFKLLVQQQKIRLGSSMMLALISQPHNPPKSKQREKSILLSPAQSI